MAAKGARSSPWNRFVESAVQRSGPAQERDPSAPAHPLESRVPPGTSGLPRTRFLSPTWSLSRTPSHSPLQRSPHIPWLSPVRRRIQGGLDVLQGFCVRCAAGIRNRAAESRMAQEDAHSSAEGPRRRMDLRLALPAALVWSASVAGLWLPPLWLAVLCCMLAVLGSLFLARAAKGVRRRKDLPAGGRQTNTTMPQGDGA